MACEIYLNKTVKKEEESALSEECKENTSELTGILEACQLSVCWNLIWKVPQGPRAGDLVLSKLLQDGSCLQEAEPSRTWSLKGTVTSGHFLPLSVSQLLSGEQPDPHVYPIMLHHVLSQVQKQQGQGARTDSAEPTSKPFIPTG